MHPLAPDLSQLSNDDLYQKYNDLQKRFNQAYRFGPISIIPQIQMMMEHYQTEISNRNAKQLEEMTKRSQEGGKGYNTSIDIS